MQGIHNDFKIDSRPYFSMLNLGVGDQKTNQKGKTSSIRSLPELFGG